MLATLDLISLTGNGRLKVQVFTKNTEDPGDGTDADAGVSIDTSTPGRTTEKWEVGISPGLSELCRYKFSIVGGAAGDRAFFRMLPPVWFDSVKP